MQTETFLSPSPGIFLIILLKGVSATLSMTLMFLRLFFQSGLSIITLATSLDTQTVHTENY